MPPMKDATSKCCPGVHGGCVGETVVVALEYCVVRSVEVVASGVEVLLPVELPESVVIGGSAVTVVFVSGASVVAVLLSGSVTIV